MTVSASSISSPLPATAVTDVYTDLNGLRQLQGASDQDAALKKVAQQFESMFIHMMLKGMRSANAVFEEDSLFKSEESNFYRDMHDHQLSLTLAHRSGFGIADALYRQMSRDYGDKSKVESAGVQRASVSNTPEEFINLLMPKVKKAATELGVDPELIVAQAALETGWGSRVIADENGNSSNNLFNIKADAGWRDESIAVRTLEHLDGTFKPVVDDFRRYGSLEESIEDYVRFIKDGSRYQDALGAQTGAEYLDKLQRAGYATDPAYADKILSVYEKITSGKRS